MIGNNKSLVLAVISNRTGSQATRALWDQASCHSIRSRRFHNGLWNAEGCHHSRLYINVICWFFKCGVGNNRNHFSSTDSWHVWILTNLRREAGRKGSKQQKIIFVWGCKWHKFKQWWLFFSLSLRACFYSVFAELWGGLNPTMANCHLCQGRELFTFKAHNESHVRGNSVSSIMAD